MAEVLRSIIKHDGEVFEAGSPASKLPKKVRETARRNGFLIEGPKKAKKLDTEVDSVVNGEATNDTTNEPDTEE